jgi:hypothetical protein
VQIVWPADSAIFGRIYLGIFEMQPLLWFPDTHSYEAEGNKIHGKQEDADPQSA